jgi:hypothetical protein
MRHIRDDYQNQERTKQQEDYFREVQRLSYGLMCSCKQFNKTGWCNHMPPGAVRTRWNEQG